MGSDFAELEAALGYHFRRPELLGRALTHRSFANEAGDAVLDNERLEFLGDAVIGLSIGHELMERMPEVDEGALSVRRAELVSEVGLSSAARALDLGRWLRLGRGEDATGGRDKSSILSDAFEATIAAVYLDGGFETARELVIRLLQPGATAARAVRDFKTRLQEAAQGSLKDTPRYELVDSEGPDHDKTFTVRVMIGGDEHGRARGKSKKAAEQEAARLALADLGLADD